jgi:hypothetical protein
MRDASIKRVVGIALGWAWTGWGLTHLLCAGARDGYGYGLTVVLGSCLGPLIVTLLSIAEGRDRERRKTGEP